MSTERPITDIVSRRTALTGVATVGLGIPFLAACGSGDETASDAGSSGADSSASGPLAATTDIEVGGGMIFDDVKAVVTQPTAGQFKCFTSICTHTGCPVTKVEDGSIICPCHGSHYSIEDGSVQSGPAPKPLAEKQITVTGDQITLA